MGDPFLPMLGEAQRIHRGLDEFLDLEWRGLEAQARRIVKRVIDRQLLMHDVVLRHVGDAGARHVARGAQGNPIDKDRAAGCGHDPAKRIHERRFALARAADDAHETALAQFHVDGVKDAPVGDIDRKVLSLEGAALAEVAERFTGKFESVVLAIRNLDAIAEHQLAGIEVLIAVEDRPPDAAGIVVEQDVVPMLEANLRLAAANREHRGIETEPRRVASILVLVATPDHQTGAGQRHLAGHPVAEDWRVGAAMQLENDPFRFERRFPTEQRQRCALLQRATLDEERGRGEVFDDPRRVFPIPAQGKVARIEASFGKRQIAFRGRADEKWRAGRGFAHLLRGSRQRDRREVYALSNEEYRKRAFHPFGVSRSFRRSEVELHLLPVWIGRWPV